MAISPYTIQGGLNFGNVPGRDDYAGAYQNALNLNQQNYANILAGYQGTMGAQSAAQQDIEQGYNNLSGQVMGDISGIDASQRQAIADQYAQSSGQQAQGLINRGLGNTTVANSVQRGLLLDKQKADIALSNQMAQLTAGYRSQLGLAGLNYKNQANMQNTALGSQQLGFQERVSSPYPNAKAYADANLQKQTMAMARQGMNRGAGGGIGGGGGGGMGAVGARGGFAGIGGGMGGGGGMMQQGQGGYGGGPGGATGQSKGGANFDVNNVAGRDENGNLIGQKMTPNPALNQMSDDEMGGGGWGDYNWPGYNTSSGGYYDLSDEEVGGGGWGDYPQYDMSDEEMGGGGWGDMGDSWGSGGSSGGSGFNTSSGGYYDLSDEEMGGGGWGGDY